MSSSFDLRDPRFNLREVCKNWLLLEQHLSDTDKFCGDCIRKHAMLAEAYTDEAYQLDAKREYAALIATVRAANRNIHAAIENASTANAAAIVRAARKNLQPLVF